MSRNKMWTITSLTLWVFFSCITSVFMFPTNIASTWQDPGQIVTFDISINIANPLQIGQTVNVTCVSHNLVETATVELLQVAGRSQRRVVGNRSPLSHERTISAADHGTQLYCGSTYALDIDGRWETYYATSERIELVVQGVSTPAVEPNPSQFVHLRVDPEASSYNQYTDVGYMCEVENLSIPPIQIKQRKGNLIRTLYSGYHSGLYFPTKQNITTSDDGTQIYCQANTADGGLRPYSVLSEAYNLNIN